MRNPRQQLLLQLGKVENLLHKMMAETKELEQIRVPFYFHVPTRAYHGLETLQFCIEEMREEIKNLPF